MLVCPSGGMIVSRKISVDFDKIMYKRFIVKIVQKFAVWSLSVDRKTYVYSDWNYPLSQKEQQMETYMTCVA
jgi:S-formylglutathione hydrolase FrmB